MTAVADAAAGPVGDDCTDSRFTHLRDTSRHRREEPLVEKVTTISSGTSTESWCGSLAGQRTSTQVREDFLASHSPATGAAYRYDLAFAERFLVAQGLTLLEAERRDLQRLVAHCRQQGLAPRTIARRLSALSGLYSFACAEGLIAQSPMLWVRRPRMTPHPVRRALDREEARMLLIAAHAHSSRAAALVTLLLGTGVRISAACSADASDLLHGPQVTTLRYRNKGGGTAEAVLSPLVQEVLDEYLQGRTTGPLLTTAGPVGRLDRTAAHRLLKQVVRSCLPHRPDISAHSMRSAFAQLALQAGAGLSDVSLALAHVNVAHTQPYLAAVQRLQGHPAHAVAEMLETSLPQRLHRPLPGT